MLITVILYWLSLIILFFCYIGYGLLLFLFNHLKRPFVTSHENIVQPEWPPVTLVIPAYNEGKVIEQKIMNSLEIDYPADRLRIIFVTDGSTDGSEKLIENHPSLKLLHEPERQGEMAATQRAMPCWKTPTLAL